MIDYIYRYHDASGHVQVHPVTGYETEETEEPLELGGDMKAGGLGRTQATRLASLEAVVNRAKTDVVCLHRSGDVTFMAATDPDPIVVVEPVVEEEKETEAPCDVSS